jgi:hypothetical protein
LAEFLLETLVDNVIPCFYQLLENDYIPGLMAPPFIPNAFTISGDEGFIFEIHYSFYHLSPLGFILGL